MFLMLWSASGFTRSNLALKRHFPLLSNQREVILILTFVSNFWIAEIIWPQYIPQIRQQWHLKALPVWMWLGGKNRFPWSHWNSLQYRSLSSGMSHKAWVGWIFHPVLTEENSLLVYSLNTAVLSWFYQKFPIPVASKINFRCATVM